MIVEEVISVAEDSWQDIIMPMIRRVVPSIIASEIVGVQPMSAPSGLFPTSGSTSWTALRDEIASKVGRDDS